MKVFVLCLLLLGMITVNAQHKSSAYTLSPLPLQQNHIVYTDTVLLDASYMKDRLFGNAHNWYINNFQTADNVLIIDNTEMGQMTGTGILHFKPNDEQNDNQDVLFTIDLFISNGKYAYRVYDILGKEKGKKFSYSDMYKEEQYPLPKPQWQKPYREYMLARMNAGIQSMLQQLKNSMKR